MARGDGGVTKRTYRRGDRDVVRWRAWIDRGPGTDRRGEWKPRIVEEHYEARERDAKDWLAAERARMRRQFGGRAGRGRRLTVGELLDDWIAYGAGVGEWSPSHLRRSRQMVDHYLDPLRGFRVDQLGVADVEDLLGGMRQRGLSSNSVRLARAALSAAFNLAVRREVLPRGANVAAIARGPKVRREAPRFLSPDQVSTFMRMLAGDPMRAFYLTAMTLALRPGEAIGLRWDDVDLDARSITIRRSIQHVDGRYHERERPKDDETRTLPLPDFLLEALRYQRHEQSQRRDRSRRWADPGLVFTNRSGGPIYEPWANRHLRTLLARAGLPRVTLYQLRHTGATALLALGVPERQVQELMGHSSPAMTRRYAQVLGEQQRDAAARMDAFLRAAVVGRTVGSDDD